MSKKPPTLDLPCRIIFFRYKSVPDELHAVCLETGSFGVGSNPAQTVESLVESVFAQMGLDLRSSHFVHGVDPEWEQAWKDGKLPSEDAVIVAKGEGTLSVEMVQKAPRVSFNDPIRIHTPVQTEPQTV